MQVQQRESGNSESAREKRKVSMGEAEREQKESRKRKVWKREIEKSGENTKHVAPRKWAISQLNAFQ